MKAKLIRWFTGPAGPIITPIIGAFFGAIIGALYEVLGRLLAKVPELQAIFEVFWSNLTPEAQAFLSPFAVGTAAAVVVWGCIQEWMNKTFGARASELQEKINAQLPPADQIEVDRAPLDETMRALDKVIEEKDGRDEKD